MDKQKSLSHNAILNSLRTLANIIFPLITYPYITRILSVDNIGKISFGQSIISYFLMIAALGISTFAVRTGAKCRDDEKEFNSFANRIFTINLISASISCLLLLMLMFLPTQIAEYRDIILIQGIAVAVSPFAVEWLYIIKEDYAYITFRSILVQIVSLIVMVCFVKESDDVYIYVAITTFASSMGNLFNFSYSRKYIHLKITTQTYWKEYKQSILLFFVNSVSTLIYVNSDITLLGLLSNDYSVGLYSIATKIYTIFKQLFNSIISAVSSRLFYLEKNNVNKYRILLTNIFQILFLVVVPAMFGVILLSEDIVMIIAGKDFIEASRTLTILSIALIFAVLANVIANGILVNTGKEKYVAKATTISAVENICLNFILIPIFNQNGAAITTLLAEITIFIIVAWKVKDEYCFIFDFRSIFNVILSSTVMFMIANWIKQYITEYNIVLRLAVIIMASMLLYFGIMFILKDRVIYEILRVVKTKVDEKQKKF